jgi:hypothetical protein
VLLDGPLHVSFIDWKYNIAASTVLSFPTVPIPMYYEHLLLFQKLETGQDGAITQNFYFQFYFNVLDLNIEPKLNITKIGLIKI